MNRFVEVHRPQIVGELRGWDRLRLRGILPYIAHAAGLQAHLRRAGQSLADFGRYLERCSIALGRCVEQATAAAGRKLIRLRHGGIDKEAMAREIAAREQITAGLICTLSAVENCRSFKLGRDAQGQWRLYGSPRQCLHYYHYLIHPVFGFMHLRIQSWAPFTLWLCLNGREWLSRQLQAAGVGYLRKENCFVRISDLGRAQQLMQQQVDYPWKAPLDALVQQYLPGLEQVLAPDDLSYYWSIEESEWAVDLLFQNDQELTTLFQRLTRHGIEHLGARDTLRFLGQKVPTSGWVYGNDHRQIYSSFKRRPEGICIKHRLEHNQIKCYQKQGYVLRTEVTINHPSQFKVPRWDEDGLVKWMPMRKGVVDARRRAEVSDQACERYLEAMAVVQTPQPLQQLTQKLCRPVTWGKQQVRGLRPLEEEEMRLLALVNQGEFAINGFRNRDLRQGWFGPDSPDPQENKRRSAQITRKLRLLRAHGLVHKLPGTHRYQVSDTGRQAISALLAAAQADITQLTKAA